MKHITTVEDREPWVFTSNDPQAQMKIFYCTVLLWVGLVNLPTASCLAAVFIEDFGDSSGWEGLTGEAVFTEDTGFIQLAFNTGATVGFLDGFRALSGTADSELFGNYSDRDVTGIQLDFFGTAAPEETQLTLSGGGEFIARTFSYSAIGTIAPFTFNLGSSSGWMESTVGAFNTVITSVDEIQVSVNNTTAGEQTFRLHEFSLLDTPIAAAIPEPGSSLFVLGAAVLFLSRYRRRNFQVES